VSERSAWDHLDPPLPLNTRRKGLSRDRGDADVAMHAAELMSVVVPDISAARAKSIAALAAG
jgi:hypothetical protein